MELYIVRHGKTEWNAAGRVQGHADIQLNEEGRAAAKALGKELKDTPLYAIYSSPLQRAKETAVLIRGDHKCPLIVDDRLIEISFGDLVWKLLTGQGQPTEELGKWIWNLFVGEWEANKTYLVYILLLAVAFSLLKNFALVFAS